MPVFYTLPPSNVPYPFVLINANNPWEGIRYINRYKDIIEAVIIDSGVEIFRDPSVREYPGGPRAWIERLVSLWRRVMGIVPDAETVVTVPDYPDDYNPKSLWESEERTNMERTLDNISLAINEYTHVDWLIPVQGHYENPETIIDMLEMLDAIGAFNYLEYACLRRRPCLAVANICVSKKCSTIERTLTLAWRWLNNNQPLFNRIHVFGPAVNCIKKISNIIYSWDSMAWTKPRSPGGSSAYSATERSYLFLTWIHRYADIIQLPAHPKTMRKRIKVMTRRL